MKQYLLFIVSAVVLAFTSCADGEEIDILYQNQIEIKVNQLIEPFREHAAGDFKLGDNWSIRVQSFIYDESGSSVASVINYVRDYNTITTFTNKLPNGNYTILSFADFVQGESAPQSDQDITFSEWNVQNVGRLEDVSINSASKYIGAGVYEVLGATKTNLVIDGSQTNLSISIKPITCLVYFQIDYLNEYGQYLRAENLSIIGERTNNIANWDNDEWSWDSSFKINSKTNVITIHPLNSIQQGYGGFKGYRAFLPTKNMKFWFSVDLISTDGVKISLDSSEKDLYTDTYDLEAGKQYILKMLLPEFSISLAPFSSTSSKSISDFSSFKPYDVNGAMNYKVSEILQ